MTRDILAISAISTDVERVFNLRRDVLSYHCSSLVANIILNIIMIKYADAVKLKAEFKSHELIKEKRAFDAQKQEKNKDLIFIIDVNEDLEYISNVSSNDDVDDNERDK